MASTYVNDLRLEEIGTGEQSGTWGDTTNTNLELIAEAFGFGTEAITTNADTHTTTVADGATDPGRSIFLKYTGTLDSTCTITLAPNTISKLWFIHNATSGSQSIIITQGSGANVTIATGQTKAVYTDGAGSGAVVTDAFATLSIVDLLVDDDLTVVDDVAIGGLATVGGTLGVTGVLTANAGVVVDTMTLDAATLTATGDFTVDSAGDIILDADGQQIILKDGGTTFAEVYQSSNNLFIEAKISDGDILFRGNDGGSDITALTLDMSAAGAAAFNGVLTANAGVVVDEMTLDGDTLTATDTFTIDAVDDITLNSDNSGRILFGDASILYGIVLNSSSNFVLEVGTNDKDMLFKGQDGGASITALTLDMSDAGTAKFNQHVDLLDNMELRLGTGNDYKFDYNSSRLNIIGTGDTVFDITGDFYIDVGGSDILLQASGTTFGSLRENSSNFRIKSEVSDKDMLFMGNDGGAEITALTLDMSDAGSATFNHDAIFGDNGKAVFGASSDLVIYHDGSNSYVQDGGTGQLRIDTNGTDVRITKTDSEFMAKFITDGAVELYHNNVKKFETTAAGNTATGVLTAAQGSSSTAAFNITGSSSPGMKIVEGSGVTGQFVSDSSATYLGSVSNHPLVLRTNNTERMRIAGGDGFLYYGTGGVEPSASQTGVRISGTDNTNFWKSATPRTSAYDQLAFFNGNGLVGLITTENSATTYATSSDYRLKENVDYDWDATTRLKQLKPARFNFIVDADTTVDGFLAHEAQAVVPEAVTGTHNETQTLTKVVLSSSNAVLSENIEQSDWTAGKSATTDEGGNAVAAIYPSDSTWAAEHVVPKMQGIDQSKLVPLLVKTILELEARITALEA